MSVHVRRNTEMMLTSNIFKVTVSLGNDGQVEGVNVISLAVLTGLTPHAMAHHSDSETRLSLLSLAIISESSIL